MRVLLVRPPFYSIFGTEDKVGNIPLGLCYLASSLEGAGHNAKILDCETLDLGVKADAGEMSYTHELNVSYEKYAEIMGNKHHPIWKKIADLIMAFNAPMVGFTAQTTTMSPVIYLSNLIKRRSESKVVIGGVHPTALPELSLEETGADVAVIGEGERTIVELADGVDVEDIRGIAYLKDDEVHMNEPREQIEDLDSIPFPARHLLDRSRYKASAYGYITSSRGCPFDCCFCASKVLWGRRTRFRSVENVLDEIAEVAMKYTHSFRFTDDTFTLDKERLLEFCSGIRRRGLGITFRCGARTDIVDQKCKCGSTYDMELETCPECGRLNPKVLQALRKAGCVNMSFGIETGSQRIIDLDGKQTTVEKAVRAIKLAKEANLDTLAFFIVGHPTETRNDIKATTKLINKLEAHRTSVSMMTPYPGTSLYKSEFGQEWWKYYHQGKAVKSLCELGEDELSDLYSKISQWVRNMNMGIKEPSPLSPRRA